MKDTNKETEELGWFLRFQAKCKDCPKEIPIQSTTSSGRPDIYLPDSKLAIEITRFFSDQTEKESKLKKLQSIRDSILERAQQIYSEKSQSRLSVGVFWQGEAPLENEYDFKLLAFALVDAVHEATKHFESAVSLEWEQLKDTPLCHHVDCIQIQKLNGNGRSLWQHSMFGGFSAHPQAIKTSLQKKESNVPRYRKFCSTVWLLIVADGSQIHSQIDGSDPALNSIFQSSFDRVFIYDVFEGWIKEIRLNA